jgi:serine protease Do
VLFAQWRSTPSVSGVAVSDPSDVAAGIKKAIDGANTDKDKDTVKVLMQVKSGDQTGFVALSLKRPKA